MKKTTAKMTIISRMLGLILFSDGKPVNDAGDGGGGRIRNGGALTCNKARSIFPNLEDDLKKEQRNGYHGYCKGKEEP